MSNDDIKNRIASLPAIPFEPGVSDSTGDNLCIALATYFSNHPDRPEGDEPDPDNGSWGVWVVEKTNDLLARIVSEGTNRT